MLFQTCCQLFGDTLARAELFLDVGQLAARFLQKELANAEVDGRVNVNEKDCGEQQNRGPVPLEQEGFVWDEEAAFFKQKETDRHEKNRGGEKDIGNHKCSY